MNKNTFFDKFKIFKSLDPVLTFLALASALVGLIAIYSATNSMGTPRLVIIQGVALLIGFICLTLISNVDYELFMDANNLQT